MAIKSVRKNERIVIEIEGVNLIVSRILSSERQRVADRNSNKGLVKDRAVMDELLKRHVHGYQPNLTDANTWIYDDDGEFVEEERFDSSMVLKWAESIKIDIYDKLHENEIGQDIRDLEKDERGRAGNSKPGYSEAINLVD